MTKLQYSRTDPGLEESMTPKQSHKVVRGGGDGQQSRSVFCLRCWFHECMRCSFKSRELDILPSKSAFYCMIIFRIKIHKRTDGLNGILDTAGKGFMKNVSGTQPREAMSL